MNREMGAVVIKPTSKPSLSGPSRLESGAPISRSARTGLPSDWPVGVDVLEASSSDSSSAATVTQAGGLNGLPAFSAQAPAGKRAGTEEPASGEALRVPETLGGVLGPVGGL